MILIFLLLTLSSSQACVNSCCQACAPEQCQACYKLNNNPVMCPCLEEIGDSRGETLTIQRETSNQYAETIKDVNLEKDLPRLSKFQSSSRKSQFSMLGGSVGKLMQWVQSCEDKTLCVDRTMSPILLQGLLYSNHLSSVLPALCHQSQDLTLSLTTCIQVMLSDLSRLSMSISGRMEAISWHYPPEFVKTTSTCY